MNSATERMVWVLGFFRLAPAEKAPPASSPVRMTQRISSSSSIAAKMAIRPSLKSGAPGVARLGPAQGQDADGAAAFESSGMGVPPHAGSHPRGSRLTSLRRSRWSRIRLTVRARSGEPE